MIRKHLKRPLLRASHSRWGLALLQNPSEKTKALIPTFDHSQGLDELIWDVKDEFYTQNEKKFKNVDPKFWIASTILAHGSKTNKELWKIYLQDSEIDKERINFRSN